MQLGTKRVSRYSDSTQCRHKDCESMQRNGTAAAVGRVAGGTATIRTQTVAQEKLVMYHVAETKSTCCHSCNDNNDSDNEVQGHIEPQNAASKVCLGLHSASNWKHCSYCEKCIKVGRKFVRIRLCQIALLYT